MSVSPKTVGVYSVIFAAGLAIGSAVGFFGLDRGSTSATAKMASDRMAFDPYEQAATYSGESVDDVVRLCVDASRRLKRHGVSRHPALFAISMAAADKWLNENPTQKVPGKTFAEGVEGYEALALKGEDLCRFAANLDVPPGKPIP